MSKAKKIAVVALMLGSVVGTTFTLAGPPCSLWEKQCYEENDQAACERLERYSAWCRH